MTTALTGNEVFQVLPIQANGQPAATTQQVTTAQVAALASTEGAPFIVTAITTAGAGVLTAAGLVGGEIIRTGPVAAFSDATDTAANIITAAGGIIGSSFSALIKNATAFPQTITAGLNVTLPMTVLVPPFTVANYVGTISTATTVTFVHVDTPPICIGGDITAPTFGVLATNGAGTLTAALMAGGLTSRTTVAAAATDTTDTAANIVAAIGSLVNKVGTSFRYIYQNNSTAPVTITGGMGVTVSGITVVPPGFTVEYLISYTAATPTVTMVGVRLTKANNITPITSGATLSVTPSMANSTILMNQAAGATITMPVATGSGNKYRFEVTATLTSNANKILAASTSDFISGIAAGHVAAGTTLSFTAVSTTMHSVQQPFSGTTPAGGAIGDWFEYTDVAPNLWQVNGAYLSGTTSTTPFSTANT